MKRRAEREAKRAVRGQAQPTKGVREKKRKVKEMRCEVITDDDEDKENSHPNLPLTKSLPLSSPRVAYTCRDVTVEDRSVLRLRRLKKEEGADENGRNGCAVM